MDKNTVQGHLAIFSAYTIFGLNIVFCKDIANCAVVAPIVLFSLRAIGASALFWCISLFTTSEKVDRRDLPKIAMAAFLGLFMPQITFLEAITMSTAVDTSIVSTLCPVFTMIFAAVFLKEPITFKKVGGVALSFVGVIVLILSSAHRANGVNNTSPLGFVLLFLNSISFASYLGIFRPLASRYSVITFMKWMFLFAMCYSLPFSLSGLFTTDYSAIPAKVIAEIGFLIVFATVVAYYLIPLGQKKIRPTLVSMYTYLQPMIACIVSVCSGLDKMDLKKFCSMVLVFVGVWFVNSSRSAEPKNN